MFRKNVRKFYPKSLTNTCSGGILYSNSCSKQIFDYGGMIMNYNSRIKNEHINDIYRRNAIRASINKKINRKYDKTYIMMCRLKRAMATFVLFAVITTIFSLSSTFTTSAKSNKQIKKHKYYTTVEIQKGDTLTSISKKYYDENEYKSLDEYMYEMQELNNLEDNTIHSGCYLKMAYYK